VLVCAPCCSVHAHTVYTYLWVLSTIFSITRKSFFVRCSNILASTRQSAKYPCVYDNSVCITYIHDYLLLNEYLTRQQFTKINTRSTMYSRLVIDSLHIVVNPSWVAMFVKSIHGPFLQTVKSKKVTHNVRHSYTYTTNNYT